MKNTLAILLNSNWFCMSELALKNTPTTLLGLDWLYLFMIYWTWAWEALGLPHWTWILLNTGFGLINQPSRDVVTKYEDFLELTVFYLFNITLIHASFTAPSFCVHDDISIHILCFLCISGYCMSLSHIRQ